MFPVVDQMSGLVNHYPTPATTPCVNNTVFSGVEKMEEMIVSPAINARHSSGQFLPSEFIGGIRSKEVITCRKIDPEQWKENVGYQEHFSRFKKAYRDFSQIIGNYTYATGYNEKAAVLTDFVKDNPLLGKEFLATVTLAYRTVDNAYRKVMADANAGRCSKPEYLSDLLGQRSVPGQLAANFVLAEAFCQLRDELGAMIKAPDRILFGKSRLPEEDSVIASSLGDPRGRIIFTPRFFQVNQNREFDRVNSVQTLLHEVWHNRYEGCDSLYMESHLGLGSTCKENIQKRLSMQKDHLAIINTDTSGFFNPNRILYNDSIYLRRLEATMGLAGIAINDGTKWVDVYDSDDKQRLVINIDNADNVALLASLYGNLEDVITENRLLPDSVSDLQKLPGVKAPIHEWGRFEEKQRDLLRSLSDLYDQKREKFCRLIASGGQGYERSNRLAVEAAFIEELGRERAEPSGADSEFAAEDAEFMEELERERAEPSGDDSGFAVEDAEFMEELERERADISGDDNIFTAEDEAFTKGLERERYSGKLEGCQPDISSYAVVHQTNTDKLDAGTAQNLASQNSETLIKEIDTSMRRLTDMATPEEGLLFIEKLQKLQKQGRLDVIRNIISQRVLLCTLASMACKCFEQPGMHSSGAAVTVPMSVVVELTRQMLREGKLSATDVVKLWFQDEQSDGPAKRLLPLRGIENAKQLMHSIFVNLTTDILNSNTLTPESKKQFLDHFKQVSYLLSKKAIIGNQQIQQTLLRNIEQHAGIAIIKKNKLIGPGEVKLKDLNKRSEAPVPGELSSVNIDKVRIALADRKVGAGRANSLPQSSSLSLSPLEIWQQIQAEKKRRFNERSIELSRHAQNAQETNSRLAEARLEMKESYARENRKMLAERQYVQDEQRKAQLRNAAAAAQQVIERGDKLVSSDVIHEKNALPLQAYPSSSGTGRSHQEIILDSLPLPPSEEPGYSWSDELDNQLLALRLPDVPRSSLRQRETQRMRAMEGLDAAGKPFVKITPR